VNLRTSLLAALKQSRPCAFCTERIRIGTPATLVVRRYLVAGRAFEYVHPMCSIDVAWARRSGMGYHHYAGGKTMTFRLYPADTPTSTFRMDSAYVRAGL